MRTRDQTRSPPIDTSRRWVKVGVFPWRKLEEICVSRTSWSLNEMRGGTNGSDCSTSIRRLNFCEEYPTRLEFPCPEGPLPRLISRGLFY
jgi:hypothetical protein